MKLLAQIQAYAAFVGLHRPPPGINTTFNRRNIVFILSFGIFFISSTAFLIFNAKTFLEYEECFFGWCTCSFVYVGIIIFFRKLIDTFDYVEKLEQTFEKRM